MFFLCIGLFLYLNDKRQLCQISFICNRLIIILRAIALLITLLQLPARVMDNDPMLMLCCVVFVYHGNCCWSCRLDKIAATRLQPLFVYNSVTFIFIPKSSQTINFSKLLHEWSAFRHCHSKLSSLIFLHKCFQNKFAVWEVWDHVKTLKEVQGRLLLSSDFLKFTSCGNKCWYSLEMRNW